MVRHCIQQVAAGPQQCGDPPTAPDWIVTVCGSSTEYEAVVSCVPGNLPPYAPYDSIVCTQNPTTTFVAACAESPHPPVGPNFIDVTCDAPVTLFNAPVDPATCVAGTSAPPNVQTTTCTTVPAGPYAVPGPVPAPCLGGMDGSFVVTTCSNPVGPNNQPPVASAPCVEGSTTDGSQVTTTCAKSDVTDYVPTALCANVAQAGTGPSVTCTTTPTLGVLDSGCAVGNVDGAPFFDTTTACTTTIVQPKANAAACAAGAGPGPGQVTLCSEVPIDVLVSDAACADGTDANGIRTQCSVINANGHKYYVIETDTVTTTPYSGAIATGPGVTVTTVSLPTPVDNTCYPNPQVFAAQPPVTIAGCAAWPCTVDTIGPGVSENSLADVAQYYYRTDLRPGAPLADKNRVIPVDPLDPEADNATHQHMTTFVVALGVSGTLNFRPDYRSHSTVVGDFADIRKTVKFWPQWPDPMLDYTNSDNYNNKKAIDDYWHTAVNGRGLYFSADNPTSVINGLGDALFGTEGAGGSGSADTVSTLQPTSTNNFVYSTSYVPGPWYGDISAFRVDPSTGIVSGDPLNPKPFPLNPYWSAKDLLDKKVTDFCDDRKIFVIHNRTTLSDFTWNTKKCPGAVGPGVAAADGLDATEKSYFSPLNVSLLSQYPFMTDGVGGTPLQQQEAQLPGKLVNFLRGQRGNEGFSVGSLTNLYRKRKSVLGDIVNSQAVYVQAPFSDYAENGYNAWKNAAAQASRAPMLYVGANDGMLHAFYATQDLTDPLAGQEAWAVIPSAVLPNLYKLADSAYSRGQHEFLVDGTPVVGDAYIGGAWRTMLVGGLNAGGKGYYALDVTNAGALPGALWEFKQDNAVCPANPAAAVGNTSDCNLGLTFGKPVITKLNNTWVVIVTSGYNNVNGAPNGLDGVGFLYVLNAQTGAIIQKIATTGGNAGTPSGLAQVNNFVDNAQIDNSTLHVYGGDLLGQMWRFDFQPVPSATLLGVARDKVNAIEPITVRPELAELSGKPFLLFGTGRLLGLSDITDVQVQSVYGFTDPLIGASPIYAGSDSQLAAQDRLDERRRRGGRDSHHQLCVRLRSRCGLGARSRRGRRAGQRRDAPGAGCSGLHEQRAQADPVRRRRPRLVHAGRLPNRRPGRAGGSDGHHVELPVRRDQRGLQHAAAPAAGGQLQSALRRHDPRQPRPHRLHADQSAATPGAGQANQLARDLAIGSARGWQDPGFVFWTPHRAWAPGPTPRMPRILGAVAAAIALHAAALILRPGVSGGRLSGAAPSFLAIRLLPSAPRPIRYRRNRRHSPRPTPRPCRRWLLQWNDGRVQGPRRRRDRLLNRTGVGERRRASLKRAARELMPSPLRPPATPWRRRPTTLSARGSIPVRSPSTRSTPPIRTRCGCAPEPSCCAFSSAIRGMSTRQPSCARIRPECSIRPRSKPSHAPASRRGWPAAGR